MKIKTSELIGPALDLAVAMSMKFPCKIQIRIEDQKLHCYLLNDSGYRTGVFEPSTDWSIGGPLIEAEEICLWDKLDVNMWCARYARVNELNGVWGYHNQTGPTQLVAAMRCLVSSKLGNVVDIPDELV